MIKSVSCPTCGRSVQWNQEYPWRPFCSERCKLIDLGEWAKESYRMPDDQHGSLKPDNEEE